MRFLKARRFDRLVGPHLPDLGRFAARLAGAEGEDLLQEALLAALNRFDGLREEGAFRVWMYRTVYTTHLDRRDREARHQRRVDAVREAQLVPFPRDPGAALEDRRLGQCLARAIDALPADQREAVWLVDVQGLTFSETAAVLGIRRGTVASRVARARSALRLDLADVAREQGVIP